MNLKYIISSVILILCLNVTFGQKILLSEDVKNAYQEKKFGKNRLHHISLFTNYNTPLFLGQENDIKSIYGASKSIGAGLAYKLRLCNHYALGIRAGLNFDIIRFENDSDFPFIDINENGLQKKRLINTDATLELYQRINFGRRGDKIGTYIDLGGYASYNLASRLTLVNKVDSYGVMTEKTNKEAFESTENFGYGITARFGYNLFALNAKYRLSTLFEKGTNDVIYPEPAVLSMGLELLIPVK